MSAEHRPIDPGGTSARPIAQVTHDLNNALTAIVNLATLIARSKEAPETVRRDAERILESAERAAALTKELSNLG